MTPKAKLISEQAQQIFEARTICESADLFARLEADFGRVLGTIPHPKAPVPMPEGEARG